MLCTSSETFDDRCMSISLKKAKREEALQVWIFISRAHVFISLPYRKSLNTKTSTLRMQIMPTEIHDAPQVWMDKQILRLQMEKKISLDERVSIEPRLVGASYSRLWYIKDANNIHSLEFSIRTIRLVSQRT